MLIFPAIDIINGACVRLTQGNYQKIQSYHHDPVHIAKQIKEEGAVFLHIVDLDGAKKKRPINTNVILDIVKATSLVVQVGGGIRSMEAASQLLDNGVYRIILGTSALSNKSFLEQALRKYGHERVVVSVDIKDQKIATNGWLQSSDKTLAELLAELKDIGIKKIIITDVEKDGMLNGIDENKLKYAIDRGFDVIAAGGVTSIDDIKKIKSVGGYGAIIGKAYYEKKIDLREAVALFEQSGLTKRIIPCLDVKGGKVVKGTHFKELRNVGDAVELGKIYSENGADELVFLDIAATIEERKTLVKLVEKVAMEINIPFAVGGGIKTIEDIKALLDAGADKVSIGSKAVLEPDFILQAAEQFGSQAIVISIDAKQKTDGSGWGVFINGGTKDTKQDAVLFAEQMERKGAGELLVNSLDRDGTKNGFDIDLLKQIGSNVSLPVVASSGAGSMEHFSEVFKETNVSAALAASIFHFKEIDMLALKKYLIAKGVSVRL